MIAADTSLEIIEQLEFDLEIPCEHSQHPAGIFGHEGPAYYYVKIASPCGCPPPTDGFYICKGGYDNPLPIRCATCGRTYPTKDVWHIIAKVNG